MEGGNHMGNEMMDLDQLASYLRRDAREIDKLARRGHLPGQKVSGRWRFARAEIDHWIETQLPELSDEQLSDFEEHSTATIQEPLVSLLLTEQTMAVPLPATTRSSLLRELVQLAEQSWHVYDPGAILEAIRAREEMGTTALPNGVALPHPHRPLESALGESVMAFGRTASGTPFGATDGSLTDIFFLVCCIDRPTHLRVLTRLSRLMLRPNFIDDLRAADSPTNAWHVISEAEVALLASGESE